MVAMGGCDDPSILGSTISRVHNAAANCTGDAECLRQIPTQQARILSSEVRHSCSTRVRVGRLTDCDLMQFSAHKYTGYYAAYSPCIESNGGLLTYNAANQLLYGTVPNVSEAVNAQSS